MKAVASKQDLVEAFTRAAGALPQRAAGIPILSSILLDFQAKESSIRATATDLEVAVIADCPATVQESGVIAVPGAKLLESVREMPDGEITVSATEKNSLTLKNGRSRLVLRGSGRDEYPGLPSVAGQKTIKVDAPCFRDCIHRTIIAASRDESRSFLTGALIEWRDAAGRLVSTDGHRLAISDFDAGGAGKGKAAKSAEPISVIAPARILSLVAGNLAGESHLEIGFGETHIIFTTARTTYYSRLIAEKFPDYAKIIPKSSERHLKLDRARFAEVLKRVGLFTNERTSSILFSIKEDRIVFSAETPEFGEAQDEIEAAIEGSAIEVPFNVRYIQDVLKVMAGDEIEIAMGSRTAPAIFTSNRDQGYRYILMPLRN
jgi:DNA polymerase-3 subunit beta